MLRRGWAGSIHGRLSSVDEASSFFEKVQLHFQLADLFVEFVLVGVALLTHLLAAVAEDVGQPGQRLQQRMPPPLMPIGKYAFRMMRSARSPGGVVRPRLR